MLIPGVFLINKALQCIPDYVMMKLNALCRLTFWFFVLFYSIGDSLAMLCV